MYDDDLSGVLPGRRFITIHPALLSIMGYHEAALIHEIRWRAAADRDEWVRMLPKEWEATLCLTTKQVRRAVEVCLEAGWIEAERLGGSWDRTRSFRLDIGAIRVALQGDSTGPGGHFSIALEGTSSYLQEPLQEVQVADAQRTGQGQPIPPIAATPPLEQTLQVERVDGTVLSAEQIARMPAWARAGIAPAAQIKTNLGLEPATPVAAEDAPSVSRDDPRFNVIRRADGLERCLKRGYGFEPSSQADRRNIAKLLDLKPTVAQLDGAIEAMGWTKGATIDLGRLVSKWATLSQFAAKRPEAWQTPRTREKDAMEAHVEAGGSKYDRDGKIDYGL